MTSQHWFRLPGGHYLRQRWPRSTSANKPLPELKLSQIYVAIWCHLATMSWYFFFFSLGWSIKAARVDIFFFSLGWSIKAAKYLAQIALKYPEEYRLYSDVGVKFLMAGRNEEGRRAFNKVNSFIQQINLLISEIGLWFCFFGLLENWL